MLGTSWTSLPKDAFDWIRIVILSYIATMYEIIYNTITDVHSHLSSNKYLCVIANVFARMPDSVWTASQNMFLLTFGLPRTSVRSPASAQFVHVLATTLFGLFGLVISLYCIYQIVKCLRWLCFGHRRLSSRHDVADGRKNGSAMLESSRWFRQAMNDLESARNDYESDCPAPEWVCCKCYQSMEKLLKAYIINRNAITSGAVTYDLVDLATLTADGLLIRHANQLIKILGSSASRLMCYPDSVPSPVVPRDVYSLHTAVKVHELTEQALEHVGQVLGFPI